MHYVFTRFLVASAATASLAACKGPVETDRVVEPVAVTVASPTGSVNGGLSLTGKIEASQTAIISTRIMGTITGVQVKTGDRVRKGQRLASISSEDIRARQAQADAMIAEAEANLKNAQKDFDRFTALYNKQSASAKELDNVTLQYRSASARVEAARQTRNEAVASMAYSSLLAPFNGVVTQRMADPGSLAAPGMPLLVIESDAKLQVTASVTESEISLLRNGDKAEVEIKSSGKKLRATVKEISPSSAGTGGQYLVKLALDETDLNDVFAGMYVNIFIHGKPASGAEPGNPVLVPVASLVHKDQLTGLYTISSNNTALLRWIRTGKTLGDKIEVLSGLRHDEKYISRAEGNLYNGAPVKIK